VGGWERRRTLQRWTVTTKCLFSHSFAVDFIATYSDEDERYDRPMPEVRCCYGEELFAAVRCFACRTARRS
jgi:hypothetical protein